jgi:metal-responsive CopG/Arc/MetJ family transcriptional regulator
MPMKRLPVSRKRMVIGVSLPPDLVKRITALARQQDISRSRVIEAALRRDSERREAA